MMHTMLSNSYLFGGNAPFVEELYEAYLADPASITPEWRDYFDKLQLSPGAADRDVAHAPIQQSFVQLTKQPRFANAQSAATQQAATQKQVQLLRMISSYRILGVRHAALDPLRRHDQIEVPELDPAYHGFTADDMAVTFNTGSLVGPKTAPLSEILSLLKQTYCGNIGVEYMHIIHSEQKKWIRERFESVRSRPEFNAAKKTPYPQAADCCRDAGKIPAHQIRRPEALLARRRRKHDCRDGRTDPARR
jgi:2-oxoglutarate dehydrogenase E1 component